MLYSINRDDSTRYAALMQNNKNDKTNSLAELASHLNDVYVSLHELCAALQGGGIMQARDIEPALASAIPVLRDAVTTLNDVSVQDDDTRRRGAITAASQSPLLM